MRIKLTCHAPDCECENEFELDAVMNATRATGFDRGAALRCIECESTIQISERSKDKIIVSAIEELESALLSLVANRWTLDQPDEKQLHIEFKG